MLCLVPVVQVSNPAFAPELGTINLPEYWDGLLAGKSWVGFYAGGSVLVSTDADLSSASDVTVLDPATLDTVPDQSTLDAIAAVQPTLSSSVSTKTTADSVAQPAPAPTSTTLRQALRNLNGGDSIVLNAGKALTV